MSCLDAHRYGKMPTWFPCPKCGYPIDFIDPEAYLGITEPNEKGEIFRFYHCPNCSTILAKEVKEKGVQERV